MRLNCLPSPCGAAGAPGRSRGASGNRACEVKDITSFCDRMLGGPWRTGTSRFKKASGHRSEKQKGRDLGKGITFPKVRSKLMALRGGLEQHARGLSSDKHFISDLGDAMEGTQIGS